VWIASLEDIESCFRAANNAQIREREREIQREPRRARRRKKGREMKGCGGERKRRMISFQSMSWHSKTITPSANHGAVIDSHTLDGLISYVSDLVSASVRIKLESRLLCALLVSSGQGCRPVLLFQPGCC
jgi:hypothetical protein